MRSFQEGQQAVETSPASPTGSSSPGTPQLQSALAKLDKKIASLETVLKADPSDEEVTKMLADRKADRDRLKLELEAARPLKAQLRIATAARDETRAAASKADDEFMALQELLEVKRAIALKTADAAAAAQQHYADLASRHAAEEGIQPAGGAVAVPVQPTAWDHIVALQHLLPPQAAQSLSHWCASNILRDHAGQKRPLEAAPAGPEAMDLTKFDGKFEESAPPAAEEAPAAAAEAAATEAAAAKAADAATQQAAVAAQAAGGTLAAGSMMPFRSGSSTARASPYGEKGPDEL